MSPERVKMPANKKPIPYTKMTYLQRIELLQNELQKYNDALPIYEYFSQLKNNKNSYVVEMRKIAAEELLAKDYSLTQISKILCRDHGTILHLFTIKSDPRVEDVVKEHYSEWINNKVYPFVKKRSEPNYNYPSGFATVLDYVLKDLK
jgi:hypothetical protein